MNNTEQEFINYVSKFIVTDVTILFIVVFGLAVIIGIIYLYYTERGLKVEKRKAGRPKGSRPFKNLKVVEIDYKGKKEKILEHK